MSAIAGVARERLSDGGATRAEVFENVEAGRVRHQETKQKRRLGKKRTKTPQEKVKNVPGEKP